MCSHLRSAVETISPTAAPSSARHARSPGESETSGQYLGPSSSLDTGGVNGSSVRPRAAKSSCCPRASTPRSRVLPMTSDQHTVDMVACAIGALARSVPDSFRWYAKRADASRTTLTVPPRVVLPPGVRQQALRRDCVPPRSGIAHVFCAPPTPASRSQAARPRPGPGASRPFGSRAPLESKRERPSSPECRSGHRRYALCVPTHLPAMPDSDET